MRQINYLKTLNVRNTKHKKISSINRSKSFGPNKKKSHIANPMTSPTPHMHNLFADAVYRDDVRVNFSFFLHIFILYLFR